jgi:hypothetical protein
MKVIRKLKTLIKLDTKTKLLLMEAYYFLALARISKMYPFVKVAPTLGEYMKQTSYMNHSSNVYTIKKVSSAIYLMSNYTFWESECLVKAIAGMRMLERRGIESTLYLGTGKDENGKLIAHSWLRSGSYFISGKEGMERFTIVGTFAKEIHRGNIEGENFGI